MKYINLNCGVQRRLRLLWSTTKTTPFIMTKLNANTSDSVGFSPGPVWQCPCGEDHSFAVQTCGAVRHCSWCGQLGHHYHRCFAKQEAKAAEAAAEAAVEAAAAAKTSPDRLGCRARKKAAKARRKTQA